MNNGNIALKRETASPLKHENKWKEYKAQRDLFIMIIPCMILTFIFSYWPLTGWIMAFEDFRPAKGYFGSPFVGFDQFAFLLKAPEFWRAFRNTVCMSALNLVFGTVFAIGFALLLNEVLHNGFKRFVQTVSYMPHFLSWVIVCSLIANMLASDGVLNNVLIALGLIDKPILWLGTPQYFWWINTFSTVWKETGWNSIIYIAAMTSIDPALYESCEIDGGSRYTKMWHITLPGIRNTIMVLLIMNIGWLLNASFEVPYLLGNRGLVLDVSQTIDIYVLKYGINIGNYSLATAAGIFKSVISIALVAGANYMSGKINEEALL
ncbi:ABC transporter permease [Mahella australiensis]|uniref:Carbohydrate ABC transporter membrane protein 1, CUT1 family n=1 Tax=Mahella australiensis (strain DSM 15567 / CIP 107919 / 50-1 BON) TaxID=697281 RepID=F3ZWI2_MAHA5|nr:ABC transporter permease subunit [Mahella australiensis]AEE95417.1 carbohydrate ABC transporter membrane protein 1, CUT1 family [Mahella australiensis 50-1 BON]